MISCYPLVPVFVSTQAFEFVMPRLITCGPAENFAVVSLSFFAVGPRAVVFLRHLCAPSLAVYHLYKVSEMHTQNCGKGLAIVDIFGFDKAAPKKAELAIKSGYFSRSASFNHILVNKAVVQNKLKAIIKWVAHQHLH